MVGTLQSFFHTNLLLYSSCLTNSPNFTSDILLLICIFNIPFSGARKNEGYTTPGQGHVGGPVKHPN